MRLRSLLCGVVLIGMAGEACAADMPDFLRGSQTVIDASGPTRWDGFYVGGQAGAVWSGTDFGNGTQSLVAFILRDTTILTEQDPSRWTTLGKYSANTTSFGGFFGWQKQFDQVVVGFEGNYNRTNINAAAMDQIGRSFTTSDGYFNDVVVTASSALHITDYGTIRIKGGWAIDCLMPYMFVGLALGRGDFSRSAHVVTNSFDPSGIKPPTHLDQSQTDNRAGAMAYGFAGGFGLDYAIYQSFFVRAEYEYVQLNAFDLKTNIQTARIGAGFKF